MPDRRGPSGRETDRRGPDRHGPDRRSEIAPLRGGGPEASGDPELIVLVDERGTPIGTAPKLATHHRDTPLHLAFSSYVFGPDGRVLATRRALSKKTWPGVWTNTCCGHPAPGEPVVRAVRRRLHYELGLVPHDLVPLLPNFRYRAELDGVVENEVCPVYGARVAEDPVPNRAEVEECRWVDWDAFVAGDLPGGLSPWAALQVDQLADHPTIARLRDPRPG